MSSRTASCKWNSTASTSTTPAAARSAAPPPTTSPAGSWAATTTRRASSCANFSGADEPYKKLQRALKAEIDENAWASLYSTVGRPFEAPSTGKIAVKVINHYGDEVLKVYECIALE